MLRGLRVFVIVGRETLSLESSPCLPWSALDATGLRCPKRFTLPTTVMTLRVMNGIPEVRLLIL